LFRLTYPGSKLKYSNNWWPNGGGCLPVYEALHAGAGVSSGLSLVMLSATDGWRRSPPSRWSDVIADDVGVSGPKSSALVGGYYPIAHGATMALQAPGTKSSPVFKCFYSTCPSIIYL